MITSLELTFGQKALRSTLEDENTFEKRFERREGKKQAELKDSYPGFGSRAGDF